jgi:hypothetical protein
MNVNNRKITRIALQKGPNKCAIAAVNPNIKATVTKVVIANKILTTNFCNQ